MHADHIAKEPGSLARRPEATIDWRHFLMTESVICHNRNRPDTGSDETDNTADGGDTNIETPVVRRLNPHTDCTQWPVCILIEQPAGRKDPH